MSDVSKTNELITKALEAADGIAYERLDIADILTELTTALEAATRVPVQGEPNDDREVLEHVRTTYARQRFMPNEPTDALALVEEVIAVHADRIGTHYEDCYKYHVACLAVAVKRRLAGEGQNE